MFRTYRVIMNGKKGRWIALASSVEDARVIAGEAVEQGFEVTFEYLDGSLVSPEDLADLQNLSSRGGR